MNYQNDDLRIKEIKELLPPVALLEKFPATENAANTVAHARKAIHKILKGNDDRLLVVIGPCSIHDPVAAKEYATRLLALREELKDELEIVMRVYFEKPRTTVGWKGLINDPHMDNSFQINAARTDRASAGGWVRRERRNRFGEADGRCAPGGRAGDRGGAGAVPGVGI